MNAFNQTELLRALPYARRFARAVTGERDSGDALVARVLGAELPALPPRLALYAAIAAAAPAPAAPSGLPQVQRQLLLLTALEDLSLADAGRVLGLTAEAATAAVEAARTALRAVTATDILVIEDEPIIALDLKRLVEACGHRVVGMASSEAEAVRQAAARKPGLILADINLGRGGDGSTAVAKIQQAIDVPVIFVTAYPERLLTAEGLEPAFVISKPFEPLALAIATYQAVHGGRAPII
ncbi:response regulator [Roseomonas sp. CECT 9278]|uniref:response regulator n=1 Tax=Roseomonas sp. CECT 9278 TaxID=2845823 RepID=UPI001E3150A8|nr:response regulator [Roseomonas sp. CECT 9278]CAH0261245.1 Phyllosphere-induced regulator PhyR [Roseomonas sp. CECT 9278]